MSFDLLLYLLMSFLHIVKVYKRDFVVYNEKKYSWVDFNTLHEAFYILCESGCSVLVCVCMNGMGGHEKTAPRILSYTNT